MSGHSKWNNIKNRKAAVDSQKSKIFGQLAKNIRLAVKEGGSGDPKSNSSLRLFLEKAREANMPKDKVEKAINAGLGKGEGANAVEITYEGFAAGGVGFIVIAFTDNSNRTTGEVRNIFGKFGGALGAPNSVKYLFTRDEKGEYVCTMPWPIEDEAVQTELQELIDALHEQEDVEDVYCVAEWMGKE